MDMRRIVGIPAKRLPGMLLLGEYRAIRSDTTRSMTYS